MVCAAAAGAAFAARGGEPTSTPSPRRGVPEEPVTGQALPGLPGPWLRTARRDERSVPELRRAAAPAAPERAAYVQRRRRVPRGRAPARAWDLHGGVLRAAGRPRGRPDCAAPTTGRGASPAAQTWPPSAPAPAPCLGDRPGGSCWPGLDDTVIAEVLYAVQASVAEGRRVMSTTSAARGGAPAPVRGQQRRRRDRHGRGATRCGVPHFTADRAGLARSDPETEQEKDVWDLRVCGAAGRLSFTGGAAQPSPRRRPADPGHHPAVAEGGGQGVGGRGAGHHDRRAGAGRHRRRRAAVRAPGRRADAGSRPGSPQPPRRARLPRPPGSPATGRQDVGGCAGSQPQPWWPGSCGTAGRWA